MVRKLEWLSFVGGVAISALASLMAASPLRAQERQVVVRGGASSSFELDVARLAQELGQKRRMADDLIRAMHGVQMRLQTQTLVQVQREKLETTLRHAVTQLSSLDADGRRIQKRLRELCSSDEKPDGWVGVVFSASVTPTRDDVGNVVLRFLDYPSVESVEPGSPAERGGIEGGDLILSMAGEDLRNREIIFSSLLKPGNKIPFRVRRGMETKLLTVTVQPRPDDFTTPCPWVDESIAAAFAPLEMSITITSNDGSGVPSTPTSRARIGAQRGTARSAPSPVVSGLLTTPPTPPVAALAPMPPLPPMGFAINSSTVVFAGAQLMLMTGELAEALGADRGLLVVSAGRGSPAEQSGLRAGDVLVSVDGRALTSPLVFLHAIEQSEKHEVKLHLVRKKKQVSIALRW